MTIISWTTYVMLCAVGAHHPIGRSRETRPIGRGKRTCCFSFRTLFFLPLLICSFCYYCYYFFSCSPRTRVIKPDDRLGNRSSSSSSHAYCMSRTRPSTRPDSRRGVLSPRLAGRDAERTAAKTRVRGINTRFFSDDFFPRFLFLARPAGKNRSQSGFTRRPCRWRPRVRRPPLVTAVVPELRPRPNAASVVRRPLTSVLLRPPNDPFMNVVPVYPNRPLSSVPLVSSRFPPPPDLPPSK